MAFISSLILYLIAVSFTFGQLFRLNINHIDFPLIDILILLLALTNFLSQPKPSSSAINKPWIYFLIFAWFSLLFNLFNHQLPFLKPTFYLIRLTCLISLFIWPPDIRRSGFKKFFILTLLANVIFGFIQYFFWPELTYFNTVNWDPHTFRLVSSFFDPTFTALIYLFFLIKIYYSPLKSVTWKYIFMFIIYLAISLTYSRSGLLSFLIAFSYISRNKKDFKIFFISLLLVVFSIILLPRLPGESTKLERTSSIKAKIINYQEGINLFIKSPIIGYGYNTLGYIRSNLKTNSHANFGFDGSLLTLLVTNGVIGFMLYLLGLKKYWLNSNPYHRTLIVAVLCHSLFANSLLYPWVLLFLIVG